MSHHHFQQHDMSFNSATKNISVHEISDLKTNQLKKAPPLPQPQLTMWDLSYSSSLPRVAGGPRRASAESSSQQQQHLLNKTLYPYQSLSGTQPLLFFSPPTPETVQQIYRIEPDEEPMQHLVLLPLGKTGAGKSSLLNLLLGYNEFKSKPGAKSVTDKITERTGTWTIENAADTLITVADTPGFADSMQRDEGFQRVFQDYIEDLGSRLGIDAFLLCFQCDSSTNNVMAILDHFDSMMSEKFAPASFNPWWNYVLLVFTRVDYYPNLKFPPNVLSKKQAITETLIPDIQSKYNLQQPPKYAFISSKTPNCSYNKKGQCDCFAVQKYHLDQMRTLKLRVNAILQENGGRWMPL